MDLQPTLNPGWFHLEILNYIRKYPISKDGHILRFQVNMNVGETLFYPPISQNWCLIVWISHSFNLSYTSDSTGCFYFFHEAYVFSLLCKMVESKGFTFSILIHVGKLFPGRSILICTPKKHTNPGFCPFHQFGKWEIFLFLFFFQF